MSFPKIDLHVKKRRVVLTIDGPLSADEARQIIRRGIIEDVSARCDGVFDIIAISGPGFANFRQEHVDRMADMTRRVVEAGMRRLVRVPHPASEDFNRLVASQVLCDGADRYSAADLDAADRLLDGLDLRDSLAGNETPTVWTPSISAGGASAQGRP